MISKLLFFLLILILKSNVVSANTPLEYKQLDKLPCNFKGANVGDPDKILISYR